MSDSEPETVHIPARSTASERHIHQDPECDGLDLARTVTEKRRNVLFDDEEECSICWDEEAATDGGRTTVERSRLQFELPQDETGDLMERLCVRMAPDITKRFETYADREKTSVSAVVRRAVDAHLETAAEEPEALPYVVAATSPNLRTSIRLSEFQKGALQDLADERGSSLSAEARTAIVHHLDRCGGVEG